MTDISILIISACFPVGFAAGIAAHKYYKVMTMSPLTKKGEKIKRALQKEYGKEKGKSVLYAMEKKGSVKGVTKKTAKKATKKATKKK
jgi:hypothetical protein